MVGKVKFVMLWFQTYLEISLQKMGHMVCPYLSLLSEDSVLHWHKSLCCVVLIYILYKMNDNISFINKSSVVLFTQYLLNVMMCSVLIHVVFISLFAFLWSIQCTNVVSHSLLWYELVSLASGHKKRNNLKVNK